MNRYVVFGPVVIVLALVSVYMSGDALKRGLTHKGVKEQKILDCFYYTCECRCIEGQGVGMPKCDNLCPLSHNGCELISNNCTIKIRCGGPEHVPCPEGGECLETTSGCSDCWGICP